MSYPLPISSTNLSYAWAKALLGVAEKGLKGPLPLCVTITGFDSDEPVEDSEVRRVLDEELVAKGKNPIDISALVVFPYRMWKRRGCPPCREFSDFCTKTYVPRLKARNNINRRGLYFERMMHYEYYDSDGTLHCHDQLEYVIHWWRRQRREGKRPRRSGLQVACFDPRLDHKELPRLAFPCLQQVGFSYGEDKDELTVNAFYPTQFVFDRAYGNYLGLCHLGAFMARQIGVKLVQMNCFVGCAQLGGDVTRKDIEPLLGTLHKLMPLQET